MRRDLANEADDAWSEGLTPFNRLQPTTKGTKRMLDEKTQLECGMGGVGLDYAWELTRRLHLLFSTPAPASPMQQTPDMVKRRAEWIESEVTELRDATTLVDQADAYLDVIVFAIGGLVELGIKPGALYSIVMASQFAKLWDDGQPRFREDGKWIKPPNWQAPEPELEAEVARQVASKSYGVPGSGHVGTTTRAPSGDFHGQPISRDIRDVIDEGGVARADYATTGQYPEPG